MKRCREAGSPVGRGQAAAPDADADLEALRPRLAGAAQALEIELHPTAIDLLLAYLTLLRRWGRVYNLTALREPEAMSAGHLVDCMAILPALRRGAAGRAWRVMDAGSGGGLPGVVLAIVVPEWQVVCVDAVAKKAAFIRQIALDLGLANLQALHSRVQSMPLSVGRFDLIVSRAFALLGEFADRTRAALAPGGVWAAMKARPTQAELSRLPPEIEVFHVEPLHVPGITAERCLVWMRPIDRQG